MDRKILQVIAHKITTKEKLSISEEWIVHDILREMINRPSIVTLCGPTRFGSAFREVNLKETLARNIVLSIGVDTHSDEDLLLAGKITQATKDGLDLLHFKKIKMADSIVMINGLKDGKPYLGKSSLAELAYARELNKCIEWYIHPTVYAIDGEDSWRLR